MDSLLELLEYWHWLLLAVVFIILEIISPGVFFLWLGIAAGIVGAAVWVQPDMAWEWQVLAFALLSVSAAVLSRVYLKRHPVQSEQPRLNRRGEQYIDRVFTLDEPIVNGVGKVRVDDSTWKVRGTDISAGQRVKVVGVDGVVLLVELIE